MAFQNKNLSVLVYANGFTLWHYKTNDGIKDITDGYFGAATSLMRVGDILLICAKDGAGYRIIENIEGKNITLGELR